MKPKSIDDVVAELISRIFTTKTLKEVSSILEELTHNNSFKLHANAIVDDDTLTEPQKRRQLGYLLKMIEEPVLEDFFGDMLSKKQFWIFKTGKVDYFDNFVQHFQLATEDIGLVYLVTAIELTPDDLKAIANDLSRSFGYQVILKHEINSAIIGGAQLRVENLVFDFSIRSKFQQFQRAWLTSLSKTEKLIGRNQPNNF